MKTNLSHSRFAGRQLGFTLPEVLIASSLFVLLTAAVVSTFIFGLQLNQTTDTKLGASDDARKAVIKITDDIRSATRIQLGQGNSTNFTPVATSALQSGSALQVYPTSDTNTWVRYYAQTDSTSTNYGRLCRITSADAGVYHIVVAHSLTNFQSLFTSEDSHGNVLNSDQNNRVIAMNLQLYSLEASTVKVANTQMHDFYQVRARITRRRLY